MSEIKRCFITTAFKNLFYKEHDSLNSTKFLSKTDALFTLYNSYAYITRACNVQHKPASLLLQYVWNLGTAGCFFYPAQLCLPSESPTLFHGQGCKHRNTDGWPTSKANLDVVPAPSSSCGKILIFNALHSEWHTSKHVHVWRNNWVYQSYGE
jgi:hypothetical protein